MTANRVDAEGAGSKASDPGVATVLQAPEFGASFSGTSTESGSCCNTAGGVRKGIFDEVVSGGSTADGAPDGERLGEALMISFSRPAMRVG